MIKRILVVLVLFVSLAACRAEGPLERAGERADEIGDNIKDGDPLLKEKGTMEKAGESVDKALDTNK